MIITGSFLKYLIPSFNETRYDPFDTEAFFCSLLLHLIDKTIKAEMINVMISMIITKLRLTFAMMIPASPVPSIVTAPLTIELRLIALVRSSFFTIIGINEVDAGMLNDSIVDTAIVNAAITHPFT